MYQQHNKAGQERPICRAENVRFKAPVHKMPSIPVDWHKVEMHNWNQYTTEVGSVKVKLNDGDTPTIEFFQLLLMETTTFRYISNYFQIATK